MGLAFASAAIDRDSSLLWQKDLRRSYLTWLASSFEAEARHLDADKYDKGYSEFTPTPRRGAIEHCGNGGECERTASPKMLQNAEKAFRQTVQGRARRKSLGSP